MELCSSKIKKFLILSEMEHSGSKIKKILIFSEMALSYVSGRNFPSSKIRNNPPFKPKLEK